MKCEMWYVMVEAFHRKLYEIGTTVERIHAEVAIDTSKRMILKRKLELY